MKINNRSAGMRDPDGKVVIRTGSRFTNTAVPRFLMVGVAGNSTCRSSKLS